MTWPNRIFVATTVNGIYYTDDFVDPTTQPTWTPINAGLPATDCKEFHLDPFHQLNRQYVILNNNNTLYRRESDGNWEAILTPEDIATIYGAEFACSVEAFCCDPTVNRRVWAIVYFNLDNAWNQGQGVMRSDNYGDSWVAVTNIYDGLQAHSLYSIRAIGNSVFVDSTCFAGSIRRIFNSNDGGFSWNDSYTPASGHSIEFPHINPLTPSFVYFYLTEGGKFSKLTNGNVITDLQTGIYPQRGDCMWFHPTDNQHQRLIFNYKLYVTNDAWININSPESINSQPYSIAPWSGIDIDNMFVGITINHGGGQDHIIGGLYGEEDITPIGIAGENCGVAPYIDSIPYGSGILALNGIEAVQPVKAKVHTYAIAMPGYNGIDRGYPMAGDRAAIIISSNEPIETFPGLIWVEENS